MKLWQRIVMLAALLGSIPFVTLLIIAWFTVDANVSFDDGDW